MPLASPIATKVGKNAPFSLTYNWRGSTTTTITAELSCEIGRAAT
jgi:hypothetical protein